MRTIKFRGRDENGKWWYGDLRHTMMVYGQAHIRIVDNGLEQLRLTEHWSDRINPETVGQFTGLLDRNGKEIYEGDVFTFGRLTGIITWHPDGYWCIHTSRSEIEYCSYNTLGEMIKHLNSNNIEYGVIGNIHDNPELIKEVAI